MAGEPGFFSCNCEASNEDYILVQHLLSHTQFIRAVDNAYALINTHSKKGNAVRVPLNACFVFLISIFEPLLSSNCFWWSRALRSIWFIEGRIGSISFSSAFYSQCWKLSRNKTLWTLKKMFKCQCTFCSFDVVVTSLPTSMLPLEMSFEGTGSPPFIGAKEVFKGERLCCFEVLSTASLVPQSSHS